MKKVVTMILATLALAASGSVFAASATVEYGDARGVDGSSSTNNVSLTVRENINQSFVGDVQIFNASSQTTGAETFTRYEAGVTGTTAPLVGPVSFYTRTAIGQKYTNTTNFGYYSVEPGLSAPLGAGFSAKVAFRFRSAFDAGNNDTTRTIRAGVAYDLTPKDQIGVRYDDMRGYPNQNITSVNYTRGF